MRKIVLFLRYGYVLVDNHEYCTSQSVLPLEVILIVFRLDICRGKS